ncbi:ribonuclease H-like domain-containing protein [Tanacetum coccineum]|uniref:Ribonuclease H-like domain-containing protein n=1 Tax=Tanacetum coccineum TaxID=301880 RepID=A0ABQ5B372_9ASTR
MESQLETTQTVSALKLHMLKTGDYDLWSMRMEQYLTHTDYALWEVIMNGDAPAVASASAEGPIPPKTAEQKLARKNELKAKSTLLLAIPVEHLLKSEGLDKTYDRFQKLISQLEFHGEVISQEDTNLKLLRSLPSAWNNIALIMRNKSDLDTLSMDDLYNNLKVYESEIKEMDLKCQVSMLTMRVKRFLKKIGRNLNFNGKETVSFDKTKVECYNCHRRGHFARERRAPRNQGNRNGDALRRVVPVETPANALVVQDGIGGYQMGLESLEARIVVHEKNEAVYEEDIAFLKYDVQVKDISIKYLKNQLEEALKEKDDLKLKLEKFKESLKNLTKLINSQISAKDKAGLGYDSQINESKVVHSVFNSRESDVDDSLVNDRFKTGEGFHAVPPPYTGNYMPSRPDLSFAGLDDSVYKTKVSETKTSISKTSKDIVEKPKTVRPSAPIIEDWDTDSDNDSVFRPKSDQTKPKFTKINFVKSDENVKSVNKENTHRQVEYPRKSQSPRDNRRNYPKCCKCSRFSVLLCEDAGGRVRGGRREGNQGKLLLMPQHAGVLETQQGKVNGDAISHAAEEMCELSLIMPKRFDSGCQGCLLMCEMGAEWDNDCPLVFDIVVKRDLRVYADFSCLTESLCTFKEHVDWIVLTDTIPQGGERKGWVFRGAPRPARVNAVGLRGGLRLFLRVMELGGDGFFMHVGREPIIDSYFRSRRDMVAGFRKPPILHNDYRNSNQFNTDLFPINIVVRCVQAKNLARSSSCRGEGGCALQFTDFVWLWGEHPLFAFCNGRGESRSGAWGRDGVSTLRIKSAALIVTIVDLRDSKFIRCLVVRLGHQNPILNITSSIIRFSPNVVGEQWQYVFVIDAPYQKLAVQISPYATFIRVGMDRHTTLGPFKKLCVAFPPLTSKTTPMVIFQRAL